MKSLYEQLDYLPEWTIPPVVAMLCIIIGYFLAKVLAGVVLSLFPNNRDTSDQKIKPMAKIIAKFIFWAIWSFFIGLGLTQFPLPNSAMSKWAISNFSLSSLISIITLAVILFLSQDVLTKIGARIKELWIKIPFPNLNGLMQRFVVLFVLAIFVYFGSLAVNNPRNISATLFVLSLGFIFSRVIKEVIGSGLDLLDVEEMVVRKTSEFSMYFVLATFLLTAFEIWT